MSNAMIPIPKIDVSVREATLDDFAFIDALQKRHSKQLGFLKRQAIEGKIAAGQALVATEPSGERIGYVMGQDRYFKHDNVGLVHQVNVVPGRHRAFVGATLVKGLFDRAAYGCLLYSCWCAQDIEANRFWESLGFVPLAYRAGSEKKSRVHIFWQKRIREGDTTTPWWFPSETTGGQMGAARIVLPIPPGLHWSDEMPLMVLPGAPTEAKQIEDQKPKREKRAAKPVAPAPRGPVNERGGLFFGRAPVTKASQPKAEPKPREKKPKPKNDPKLVAAARELRDRWLEQVNAGAYLLEDAGKYDVSRALPGGPEMPSKATPLLPAA